MKHQYDEPTMQAAIDAAFVSTTKTELTTLRQLTAAHAVRWGNEAAARLHLLKTALGHLPDPPPPVVDGKTPGQVNHDAVTNGDYDTYKKWSELSERGKRDVERGASAVLAAFGKTQLSTLRPIAEAGEVPAGCVRYYFIQHPGFFGTGALSPSPRDTHFADIRLPESKVPEVILEGGEVSCSNCNALAAENALLRDALSKAERLIFGSHGAVFLPGQMQAYNLAVSKIQPQIK